jgi:hypothetical protein
MVSYDTKTITNIREALLSANINQDTQADPWFTFTQSPPSAPIQPTLDLDVPAFGIVFMNPPEEARYQAEVSGLDPVYTTFLSGEFVVKLPVGEGEKKYESMYIGFKAVSKLALDPKKQPVLEELYHVGSEMPGGVIKGESRWARGRSHCEY